MLDTFIIDQIRKREHEWRDSERPRLYIEVPRNERPPREERTDEHAQDDQGSERGSVVIDFTI